MSNPIETLMIDLSRVVIPTEGRPHDPEKLSALAADMAAQGQLQEIVVTPKGDQFEVVAGVGRTLAAQKLGWKQIRASVRAGLSEFDKARITFAENEDREDADPFYQAGLLAKMITAKNCSQQALADELGISEALVNAYVAIGRLPEGISKLKRLSLGQLIQICRVKDTQKQIDLAKKTESQDLSVRQLKSVIDAAVAGVKKSNKRTALADPLADVWSTLKKSKNVTPEKWDIQRAAGRWVITVYAGSENSVNVLHDVLQFLAEGITAAAKPPASWDEYEKLIRARLPAEQAEALLKTAKQSIKAHGVNMEEKN